MLEAFVFAIIGACLFLIPRIYIMVRSNRRYVDPVQHYQFVSFFTWLAAVFFIAAVIIYLLVRINNFQSMGI